MITAFINFFRNAPEPMLSIDHHNADRTLASHWRIYPTGHVVFKNILANTYNRDTQSYNTNHIVVERIRKLIDDFKMYEFSDRYGDSLTPQPYIIIKMNTDKGEKEIHIEPSNPIALNQFVDAVISILNQVNC